MGRTATVANPDRHAPAGERSAFMKKPSIPIDRRRFLLAGGLGAAGLAGCAQRPAPVPSKLTLAPIRAGTDRIFDITVCLRPFRAAGPRLEAERIGRQLIVHNYGHGGSGWSLSWGSSTIAVQMAAADSPRDIAVLGCGALGLTSAILAQQTGARVTIYARDVLPRTRSARATGSFTPDSRIALANAAPAGFPALWEKMARTSFKTYRNYLGLPGTPVEWKDQYVLLDAPIDQNTAQPLAPGDLDFAKYHTRISDLEPDQQLMPPGSTPFQSPFVYRSEAMQFNIASYGHTLMNDFRQAGGRIEAREFHSPADLAALKESVVINCPGYGARALWNDQSITPVRGQIAWLIPQPEVAYGMLYKDIYVLSRSDGIVVQDLTGGDMKGYGDENETPDRAAAEKPVAVMSELFAKHWNNG
jgi:glycine/D-amino acid oxidase-like deaminating enzyme